MPLSEKLILIFLINFASSFVQGATGLGYALISMALMPLFLPMSVCSAISATCVVTIGLQMSFKLREHLDFKVILLPVLCCFLTINLGLYMLSVFDELLLRIILAGLLLLVSAIFFYMKQKDIELPDHWYTAAGAGLITGISTGLFNIVGPFLMIYYLQACKSTLQLKASLEASFLLAGMYSLIMHTFVYRNINITIAPELLTGIVAVIAAGVLSLKLYKKMNKEKISLFVYIFLPIMAVALIINGLS